MVVFNFSTCGIEEVAAIETDGNKKDRTKNSDNNFCINWSPLEVVKGAISINWVKIMNLFA
jgi:hypothetical protein